MDEKYILSNFKGVVLDNRTKMFILPALTMFVHSRVLRYISKHTLIVAAGVNYNKALNITEQSLFLLVKVNKHQTVKTIKDGINIICKQEKKQIIAHSEYMENHLLLEVVVDEQHYNIFHQFYCSKYSKMYTKEQINKYFDERRYSGLVKHSVTTAKSIMLKTIDRKVEFEYEINRGVDPNDITYIHLNRDENELDYRIKMQEEVFE